MRTAVTDRKQRVWNEVSRPSDKSYTNPPDLAEDNIVEITKGQRVLDLTQNENQREDKHTGSEFNKTLDLRYVISTDVDDLGKDFNQLSLDELDMTDTVLICFHESKRTRTLKQGTVNTSSEEVKGEDSAKSARNNKTTSCRDQNEQHITNIDSTLPISILESATGETAYETFPNDAYESIRVILEQYGVADALSEWPDCEESAHAPLPVFSNDAERGLEDQAGNQDMLDSLLHQAVCLDELGPEWENNEAHLVGHPEEDFGVFEQVCDLHPGLLDGEEGECIIDGDGGGTQLDQNQNPLYGSVEKPSCHTAKIGGENERHSLPLVADCEEAVQKLKLGDNPKRNPDYAADVGEQLSEIQTDVGSGWSGTSTRALRPDTMASDEGTLLDHRAVARVSRDISLSPKCPTESQETGRYFDQDRTDHTYAMPAPSPGHRYVSWTQPRKASCSENGMFEDASCHGNVVSAPAHGGHGNIISDDGGFDKSEISEDVFPLARPVQEGGSVACPDRDIADVSPVTMVTQPRESTLACLLREPRLLL